MRCGQFGDHCFTIHKSQWSFSFAVASPLYLWLSCYRLASTCFRSVCQLPHIPIPTLKNAAFDCTLYAVNTTERCLLCARGNSVYKTACMNESYTQWTKDLVANDLLLLLHPIQGKEYFSPQRFILFRHDFCMFTYLKTQAVEIQQHAFQVKHYLFGSPGTRTVVYSLSFSHGFSLSLTHTTTHTHIETQCTKCNALCLLIPRHQSLEHYDYKWRHFDLVQRFILFTVLVGIENVNTRFQVHLISRLCYVNTVNQTAQMNTDWIVIHGSRAFLPLKTDCKQYKSSGNKCRKEKENR